MNNQRKVMVVGAGIAGLTIAHLLAKQGFKVTVVEKEEKVGGLARTFRYGKYVFDIGPHRFYSSNKAVLDYLKSVLGEEVLEIERYSSVHYCGQYHTWPLRLKSVLQMPVTVSVPAFFDLFTKARYHNMNDKSFRLYILKKYGDTLYNTFFKGYTEKFVGLSPENIHFHWAKIGVERATIDEKVKTGSMWQLFQVMLMPKPQQLRFMYPHGGIDVFCERQKNMIEHLGGTVITGAGPTAIKMNENNITGVRVNGVDHPVDNLVWTAPITTLFDLMGYKQPGLKYLSLLNYNLELDELPQEKYQWCYFGDKNLSFSRTTNPSEFDLNLLPKGKGSLNVEITCMEGDEKWEKPDKLTDSVIDGLHRVKTFSSKDKVRNVHIEKIPNTYPIYDVDYIEKLGIVRDKLRVHHNLFLAGRTGLFWYNNMDHSIENAFEVVEKVCGFNPDAVHKRMEDPFHLGAVVGDPTFATV